MNAIDQYVTPAPPRPNPPPAQSSRGPETSGAPTFGDVYNKAANTNQSGNEPASSQKADDDTAQSKADGKNAAPVGKSGAENETSSTASTSAGSAILALAAELKDKKTGKDADKPADANMAEDPTVVVPKEDGKDKAAAEIQKLIDKATAAEAQGQSQASAAGSPEQDAAAIALQLLGGEAAANVKDKKALPEETAGKDEPADDKVKDAKADAAGPHADATNVMAAAALVVHAAGGQAKDQQEQGKPKSEDQSAEALAAIGTKTQGATAADETTKTAGAGETVKPETITVLDARRFVGSGEGLSANTQAVMSGVTTDNDWAATMKAASAAANATPEPRTGTPVNTLKIQMTPESLGNVTATLRLHGDQLTVHLSVESGEAFKQLSHDKDGLIQSLKSQGYSVDQVSVQLAPAPSTDRTVAQTSTGQQAGGQMQDGSSAGQFAQQGREQDNNRRQQDNGFNANWQGDDKSVAVDPVAASSDTARSGQVYL